MTSLGALLAEGARLLEAGIKMLPGKLNGRLHLRVKVPVGSVSSEQMPDLLKALDDGVSVLAGGAKSGGGWDVFSYTPLMQSQGLMLGFDIDVLDYEGEKVEKELAQALVKELASVSQHSSLDGAKEAFGGITANKLTVTPLRYTPKRKSGG